MYVVQLCIWFKEEPSQFSVGQTAESLTGSIMEKPHTGLDECPRILLSCFRARNSEPNPDTVDGGTLSLWLNGGVARSDLTACVGD